MNTCLLLIYARLAAFAEVTARRTSASLKCVAFSLGFRMRTPSLVTPSTFAAPAFAGLLERLAGLFGFFILKICAVFRDFAMTRDLDA